MEKVLFSEQINEKTQLVNGVHNIVAHNHDEFLFKKNVGKDILFYLHSNLSYTNDLMIKRIQNTYIFLYYKDIFGGQLEGYSDIEGKNVNYNERYKNQIKF